MQYRNAKYIDESSVLIDCEIEHPVYGWIPYTIDPADTDMTIDNSVLLAAIHEAGDVEPYVPPTQEELDAEAAKQARAARNRILSKQVDPIVTNPLRWAEMTAEQQRAWTDYRRALLDITDQSGFPTDIAWPTKPE